jgi:hypothetical protein
VQRERRLVREHADLLRPQPQRHQIVVITGWNIDQAVDAAQWSREAAGEPMLPEELVREPRRRRLRDPEVPALGVLAKWLEPLR